MFKKLYTLKSKENILLKYTGELFNQLPFDANLRLYVWFQKLQKIGNNLLYIF